MNHPQLLWIDTAPPQPSMEYREAALKYQAQLTKPHGSLGVLETIAVRFCAWQQRLKPEIQRVSVRVFAADHGIARHGVSAYPQAVTLQMVENFRRGGAAINVLCRESGAEFAIVNAGVAAPLIAVEGVINAPVAPGTEDFSVSPAMTEAQCVQALNLGRELTPEQADLFIAGDMGIGNTTSAAAIYAATLRLPVAHCVGPGTGVDLAGQARKIKLITLALALHGEQLDSAFAILCRVGGFEIAAMVGAFISAAQRGIPILVDGYIATAAALLAVDWLPGCREWMMFAHQSAEPAHIHALKYLSARPLVNFGMRLGEGSGAALVVPLLRSALALHNHMASFRDAGVDEALVP